MVGKQAKSIHVKCLYQYLMHKHNSYSKVFVSVITTSLTVIITYEALANRAQSMCAKEFSGNRQELCGLCLSGVASQVWKEDSSGSMASHLNARCLIWYICSMITHLYGRQDSLVPRFTLF